LAKLFNHPLMCPEKYAICCSKEHTAIYYKVGVFLA